MSFNVMYLSSFEMRGVRCGARCTAPDRACEQALKQQAAGLRTRLKLVVRKRHEIEAEA